MKKGDLVSFEYLTQHHNGVGWEFQRGTGVIVGHNPENDSYQIMVQGGKILERMDAQIEVISPGPGKDVPC